MTATDSELQFQNEQFEQATLLLSHEELAAYERVAAGGVLEFGQDEEVDEATGRVVAELRALRDDAILFGDGDPTAAQTWAQTRLEGHYAALQPTEAEVEAAEEAVVEVEPLETETETEASEPEAEQPLSLRANLGQLASKATANLYIYGTSLLSSGGELISAGMRKAASVAENLRDDPQLRRRALGHVALGASVVIGGTAAYVASKHGGFELDFSSLQGTGGLARTTHDTIAQTPAPKVALSDYAIHAPKPSQTQHLIEASQQPSTGAREQVSLQDWRTNHQAGSLDGLARQQATQLHGSEISQLSHKQQNYLDSLLHNRVLEVNGNMSNFDASHLQVGRMVSLLHPAEIEEMLAKAKSIR